MIVPYEFRSLDQSGLARVADLLESGLLAHPFTELGLINHIGESATRPLLQFFSELNDKGMTPPQMAVVLRAYLAGGTKVADHSQDIDVVISGPDAMTIFRDTGVVVRQMFTRAHQSVLAVGFAVHQGRSIFKALANRLDETEDLEVVLCIDIRREIGSTADVAQILKGYAAKFVETEWPGERFPRLYYDPRSLSSESGVRSALHAKCVAVDSMEALVTSANFTEAAQLRNIELGLHVKSRPIARQIEGHFYSLIRSGHLERLPLP